MSSKKAIDESQESLQNITSAHELSGNVEELSQHYSDWAETYDDDVSSHGYCGPAYIAQLGARLIRATASRQPGRMKRDVQILDAGCGTGLVGVELKARGFGLIDGCDLSHEMVEKAAETGAYRKLQGGVNLEEAIGCFGDMRYDAILSCGVFTLGHVAPEAVLNLLPLLREDGVIVLSTRQRYTAEHGFEEFCQKLERRGVLTLDEVVADAPYIDDEKADYWIIRPPAPAARLAKSA